MGQFHLPKANGKAPFIPRTGRHRRTQRLYRLALEKTTAATRGTRYCAVGEEGVSTKQIAEAVATGLGVPTESKRDEAAAQHFGHFAWAASADMPASSLFTQQRLGWSCEGPGLLADLAAMKY
jgi:hypothetical protein